jgi:DNA-binding NarL/FixJ family response regulator
MARLGRRGLSDEEKVEVWRRWRIGESLSDIGRALNKYPAAVFRGLASGHSMRQMAEEFNRSPSTITAKSREIAVWLYTELLVLLLKHGITLDVRSSVH